jgi:ribosome-associated translation inhibitor RaiA
MKKPLEVRFEGMQRSETLEAAARAKAVRLEHFCDDLMSCRVTIEVPHKHQLHGRPCVVRLDVTVPGHELTVARVQHEDAHIALRDAFDDMTRQLEDVVRRTRGHTKVHTRPGAPGTQ